MATKVLNQITQVTTGVTLTDTTAAIVSEVARLTIPRGTAIVIPPVFAPIFEFLQSTGVEMSGLTEIYLGIILPSDQRRVKWLGSKYMYRAWADLSIDKQQSNEFERACMMDLGVPYLPLGPEEVFVISRECGLGCPALWAGRKSPIGHKPMKSVMLEAWLSNGPVMPFTTPSTILSGCRNTANG